MDFRRIFDILAYQQSRYPNKKALASKKGIQWEYYATDAVIAMADQVSAGLLDLGLNRGDTIAVITPSGSPEWCFLDMGALQVGVILVPIHVSATPEDICYILTESAARYCFVADRELYQIVREVQSLTPKLQNIYTIGTLPDLPSFQHILKAPTAKHYEIFQGLRASIHEDDLATIIYTSGTQGEPKGVMLSHKNIVSNVKAVLAVVPVNCDKRVFSFLPISHVFERTVIYTYLAAGASIYFSESRNELLECMREVRPHYFTTVPRLLEKMYDSLLENAAQRSLAVRKLIYWAIALGEHYRGRRKMSLVYWIKWRLADLLVFRKWRRFIGGRVEGIVVGAAALQPRLSRLFSAAGLETREGYGLTETSPVVSFNRFEPGGVRFGTVGIPLPGVSVKIDAPNEEGRGEILVKGPNVMLGYFNRKEETQQQFTPDGWLRTGDIGLFVHKHFLQITDRKKDIFKTSSGKYIAPQQIENSLKSSEYIEQCMIIGSGRSFVTALIIPCFPALKRWCQDNDVHWTAPQYMVLNLKVVQFLEGEVARLNKKFKSFQQIRKFHLLHKEWSENTGELTLTLKTKRAAILQKYKKEIAQLYGER